MQPSARTLSALKLALFIACLLPFAWLLLGFCAAFLGFDPLGVGDEALGANPVEYIIRNLGDWALRFLLITLAITPLRRLTGWNWLLRFRRMLGLYAFFYALVHFNIYLGLDQSYDWGEIALDILKRPFITVGMLAFALMLPLAATSNNAAIRAMGGKAWQRLHRLVYAIAICGVLHFWWLVKLDTREPAIYAAILAVLLGARLLWVKRATLVRNP